MKSNARENSNSQNNSTTDTLPLFSIYQFNTIFGSPYMDRPHVSPQHKIVIFNTASGQHFLEQKEIPVSSQSIHFIESGKTHRFLLGRNTDVHMIYFSNNFIIKHQGNFQFLKMIFFFKEIVEPCYMVFNFQQFNEIKNLITMLETQYYKGRTDNDELLFSIFQSFILKMKTYFDGSTKNNLPAPLAAKKIHKLFEQAAKHKGKETTVESLAAQMKISTFRLNEFCKKEYGKHTHEVMDDAILLEAKNLLLHSQMSLKEIAISLKFHDSAHFTHFFSQHTQCSPSDFRKTLQ